MLILSNFSRGTQATCAPNGSVLDPCSVIVHINFEKIRQYLRPPFTLHLLTLIPPPAVVKYFYCRYLLKKRIVGLNVSMRF